MEQTELEHRKEFVSRHHPVFVLNESVCPSCFHNVEIVKLGGTAEFLEMYEADCERTEWKPGKSGHVYQPMVIGSITFQCSNCDHKFYVEHLRNGDWAGGERCL